MMKIPRRVLLISGAGIAVGAVGALASQFVSSTTRMPLKRSIRQTIRHVRRPVFATGVGQQHYALGPRETGTRRILLANELVDLDHGDDPRKDNTSALQSLMDRPTAADEVIQFPKGVFFTDTLQGRDGVHWAGEGTETVFKWRSQRFKDAVPRISPFEFTRVSRFVLENFVIDGRRNAHYAAQSQGQFGNVEGIDLNGCSDYLLLGVEVRDVLGDAFDSDNDDGGTFINCVARNTGKDGFHVSGGTQHNLYLGCLAERIAGGRGGFTQSQYSLGHNAYAACVGRDCRRNWSIRETEGGDTAVIFWCWSIDGQLPDELDGAVEDFTDSPAIRRLFELLPFANTGIMPA